MLSLIVIWADTMQAVMAVRTRAGITKTREPATITRTTNMARTPLILAMVACVALFLAARAADAQPTPTDDEIRQQIVVQSVGAYQATGHPCACPYNSASNGSSCGGRSAYSRPGGAAPLCYPTDVTDQMVADWKTKNSQAPAPVDPAPVDPARTAKKFKAGCAQAVSSYGWKLRVYY